MLSCLLKLCKFFVPAYRLSEPHLCGYPLDNINGAQMEQMEKKSKNKKKTKTTKGKKNGDKIRN